jgi:hypothetical protein
MLQHSSTQQRHVATQQHTMNGSVLLVAAAAAAAAACRFEDLARRFETPDPRNRWDAPLFTVTPGGCCECGIIST